MTDFHQSPFASTHSLDANPFDDPPQQSSTRGSREQDLRQREEDLQRREAELNNRAEHIRRHGRNNFPPFFPLIYHAINEEIPQPHRHIITRLFQLWLVLLATLVLNFVTCMVILISGSPTGGADFGSSLGYLLFMPIASFLLWYRPIYNGYMKEQSLYYFLYFFFGGFHLIFSLYMIIGIPSTGSAGLIQTIQRFTSHSYVAAVLGLIATIGWIVQGVGNAYYYRKIYRHHTAEGHTVEKAKAELATHGAKAYFTRG